MRSGIWAAIRWLIAVAALGAVALVAAPRALEAMQGSISVQRDEPQEPAVGDDATSSPTPTALIAVSDGSADPFTDFHAVDGAVADPVAEQLVIGPSPGDALYFAFDPIEGDLECLQRMQLHVPLAEATEATLGALPAAGVDPAQTGEGDALPVPPALGDPPAAPAFTDGSPGILLWDVTPTYRDWAAGDEAAEGGPFVIVIRAVGEDPNRQLVFASSEAGSPDGPQLSWSGVSGCGGDGEDSAPEDGATEPTGTATETEAEADEA